MGLVLSLLAGEAVRAVESDYRVSVVEVAEADFLKLWRESSGKEQEIIHTLSKWQAEGRASVLSSLPMPTTVGKDGETREGHGIKVPYENDQDFDEVLLKPMTMEERWVGMTLARKVFGLLSMTFLPKAPIVTSWPVTWPSRPDPFVGSVEQFDDLLEALDLAVPAAEEDPCLLAAFRPADAVFPAKGQPSEGRVHVVVSGFEKSGAITAPPINQPRHWVSVYTLSIESSEAFRLMMTRDPARDDLLLASLLDRVGSGHAALRGWSIAAAKSGTRSGVRSARKHLFPTEMPTIPSSWGEQLVGSMFEFDPVITPGVGAQLDMAIHHDLTPPRDGIWPLAMDAPPMVMRLPQFVTLQVRADVAMKVNETMLIAAGQPTACIAGEDGLSAGQTLLTFAVLNGPEQNTAPPPPTQDDPFSSSVGAQFKAEAALEIAAWVVEVPLSEEASWRRRVGTQVAAELEKRLADGTARLETLALVRTTSGKQARQGLTEEVPEVTECAPAENNGSDGPFNRIRPTTFELHPAGTQWEVTPVPFAGQITMDYQLSHDVARPLQPTLAEMIEGIIP